MTECVLVNLSLMFINVGVNRHRFPVSAEFLEAAEAYVKKKPDPFPPEFSALAEHVMEEHGLQKHSSAFIHCNTKTIKQLNLMHCLGKMIC